MLQRLILFATAALATPVAGAAAPAVDRSAPTETAGPTELFAFGMLHMSLGQAMFVYDPADCLLAITNIGDTGDDGALVDPGLAESFQASVNFGPAGMLPTAALLRFQTMLADQLPHDVLIRELGDGQAGLFLDVSFFGFKPGPLVKVDLLNDGELVDAREYAPLPAPVVTGDIGSSAGEAVTVEMSIVLAEGAVPEGFFIIPDYLRLRMPTAELLQLAGSDKPVLADEIAVRLKPVSADALPEPLSALALTAANVEQILVSGEGLGLFDNLHRSLGEAHMLGSKPVMPELIVSNLGEGGGDGVSIVVENRHLADVAMFDLQLIDKIPGAFLENRVAGHPRDPIKPVDFGDLRATTVANAGVHTELVPDLSPIGVESYTVMVSLEGKPILEFMAQTGVVAEALNVGVGAIARTGAYAALGDAQMPAFNVRFTKPVCLRVSGVIVDGDEITILGEPAAALPVQPIQGLTTVDLIGSGLGQFSITGETVVPVPPCPWDCADGDGLVGVLDFLQLLAEWGMLGTPCDLGAGLPGVGIEEFLELLANWGACP